jgi:hypothetical protein
MFFMGFHAFAIIMPNSYAVDACVRPLLYVIYLLENNTFIGLNDGRGRMYGVTWATVL